MIVSEEVCRKSPFPIKINGKFETPGLAPERNISPHIQSHFNLLLSCTLLIRVRALGLVNNQCILVFFGKLLNTRILSVYINAKPQVINSIVFPATKLRKK